MIEPLDTLSQSKTKRRAMGPLGWVLALSSVFFAFFLLVTSFVRVTKGCVGVIEVTGVIMDSKKTLAKLERAEKDDRIQAVVLRLNSPGGSVSPSQEIYQAVKEFKKPLVVSMGSVAASGAYWIACGAKKVYANAGTLTGSIGVIMQFANIEKLYEWAKVDRYSIKSGLFKDAGSEYRKMTSEERKLFQGMIDDILSQFKEVVASGRHLSMEEVTAVADGRVITGHQAKALHLVDELGTIQDAIEDAGELAHIKGKPEVLYLEKKKGGLLDVLMEDSTESSEGSSSSFLSRGHQRLLEVFLGWIMRSSGGHASSHVNDTPWLDASDFVPGIYSVLGSSSSANAAHARAHAE